MTTMTQWVDAISEKAGLHRHEADWVIRSILSREQHARGYAGADQLLLLPGHIRDEITEHAAHQVWLLDRELSAA